MDKENQALFSSKNVICLIFNGLITVTFNLVNSDKMFNKLLTKTVKCETDITNKTTMFKACGYCVVINKSLDKQCTKLLFSHYLDFKYIYFKVANATALVKVIKTESEDKTSYGTYRNNDSFKHC